MNRRCYFRFREEGPPILLRCRLATLAEAHDRRTVVTMSDDDVRAIVSNMRSVVARQVPHLLHRTFDDDVEFVATAVDAADDVRVGIWLGEDIDEQRGFRITAASQAVDQFARDLALELHSAIE